MSTSRDLHKITTLVPKHTRYATQLSTLPLGFLPLQLYHNANVSDVDSVSTHSDGTKGQLQRKGEGEGKDDDMGYKLTPVIGSGPYKGIHLGTHPWTHTDIQYLRPQG